MSSTRSRLAAAAVLGLGLALVGTPASAQTLQDNQNTTLLSVGKMINLTNAMNRLIALVEQRPALASFIPAVPGGNEKLDPYVARIQQSPEVMGALKQSSFSPKSFLQALYSLAQAETAINASQLGNQVIQPGFVADNIRTLRQNPSETNQLLRAYVRLSSLQQAAESGAIEGKGPSGGASGKGSSTGGSSMGSGPSGAPAGGTSNAPAGSGGTSTPSGTSGTSGGSSQTGSGAPSGGAGNPSSTGTSNGGGSGGSSGGSSTGSSGGGSGGGR